MNLRHRITLLIVLTFLAIVSIGGFSVYQSRGNASEVKLVTQGVVPSALASAELIGQLKDVQLAVMMIVAAPDLNLAKQAEEKLLGNQATLQKALDTQLEQADSDAQRGLVKQAKESLTNYFSAIKDTATFKLAGQTVVAEANLAANVGGYLQEMEQVIETLQIEKRRSKDGAIVALNENLTGTTTTITLVTLLAVLTLTAVGVLLYRQITLPIKEMEIKMTEISVNQDFTQRLPVNRMDEIGHSMMAFNAMIEKIQESSELVKQKTADIHAMLHSVPQGILTVQAGNRVHPEYSVYLESILETKDIADKDLLDLIFSGTQCNADVLHQIETTCSACIGEDHMNFDFNVHLLPTEIVKSMPSGAKKILDLNWSPIADDSGTTQRLLLCIRDVTELRALAIAANEQKRELSIIGEILGVQHEKFQSFMASAHEFISENRALIESSSLDMSLEQRADTISQLFRNMHTIKGNARTYGLLHLTHVVHVAEQTYDELRKDPSAAWNATTLLDELDRALHALNEYARINDIKLGRKGPGRRANTEKFLLIEKQQLEEARSLLDHADPTNLPAMRETLRQVRHSLDVIGTEKIANALAGVVDSLPSLARELGKEPPHIAIEDNGILIRAQATDMMKHVFMHLLRNALDHGIETPDQRIAKGKAAAGSITLSAVMHGNQLVMKLRDDGMGLALATIREKALEKGLISEAASLSPEDLGQLIFTPGFSTATSVTEVSGRGVGMDAVQGFIKGHGGSITLEFDDESNDSGYRPFSTVIQLPGKLAVVPILRLMQNVG